MKYFKKTELIPCYRDDKGLRCKECRLTQAAMRLPNGIEESVMALGEDVLDPAREKLGAPITVNSGFRCPLHNQTVGGVANSQHVRGEAADLTCKDNQRLARIIVEQGKFDQLIIYPTLTSSTSDATRKSSSELGSSSLLPRFIHVSWKKNGPNRGQILKKTASGYQKISSSDI